MGILISHLNVIAAESNKHPVFGDVLTLGQQAVYAEYLDVRRILRKNGVSLAKLPATFDTGNKIPGFWSEYTNAQTVFSLLGASNVYACDGSGYESPDYIINLNDNVDSGLREMFHTIVDVGTLEHIFDVSTALSNIDYMLKKGGTLILILPASNSIDHGFFSFSPTLLFDFFEANGYQNFSCYLREGNPFGPPNGKGKLYRYLKPGPELPLISKGSVEVLFFATKGLTDRKEIIKPIQSIYRHLYDPGEVGSATTGHVLAIEARKSKMKKVAAFARKVMPGRFYGSLRELYAWVRSTIVRLEPQVVINYKRKKLNAVNIVYVGRV